MNKINFFKTVPAPMKNLLDIEKYLNGVGIDQLTLELIKIRSSQLNKCSFCLNMHTVDAIKYGETNQRIFLLEVWEETNLFNDKEKLVIELTEKLTVLSSNAITKEFVDRLSFQFTSEQYANLVMVIAQISIWNRINIATNNEINYKYKQKCF